MAIFFQIHTEYITVGQLLKALNFASSGGEAKLMLQEGTTLVNDQPEFQRGKKLRPGDKITLPNGSEVVIE